jgi:hypothetical protein
MQLWQLDIVGGIRLADGTELKLVSGIDDHSRFCVRDRERRLKDQRAGAATQSIQSD